MFHIHSAKHRSRSECILVVFFVIEQWFVFYCISIVSGSINSPCWCTLFTSNKCPIDYLLSLWFFPFIMLAVVNCNLPVSDLNGSHVTIDHVMPREKRCGALDSCFGLVGPHQQGIPQLLSLASRVYKGKVERSTCGFELMRFIPTRLCSCTVYMKRPVTISLLF